MGFIYGIVNAASTSAPSDFQKLEQALQFDNSTSARIVEESFSIGICWKKGRKPNAYLYSDSSYTVAADIRIYNREQLHQQLNSETPIQTFIKAYEQWGYSCANHINGDFSVVLIDKIKRKVLLFRDHIGCRPLAYCTDGTRLIFASHEFGIAKSGITKIGTCRKTALARIFNIQKYYSNTVFKGIHKLTPGHFGILEKSGVTAYKYWKPQKIKTCKNLKFVDAVSLIREKIIAATMNRVDDGLLGVHVSGGIDSTGIASILADSIDDKLRLTGYSWTPSYKTDPIEKINQLDEIPFIRDFINDKSIAVRFLEKQKTEDFLNDSTQFDFEFQHIEQPTMRQAAQDNVSILFSGWGGDEFVTLSNRGVVSHLFFRLYWGQLIRYIKKIGFRSFITLFRREVLSTLVPFGMVPAYKSFPLKNAKYVKPTLTNYLQIVRLMLGARSIFSIYGRKHLALNLIESYHLPQRMDSWAINAEKYGIDYRYPLLDKDLLEFWFAIPQQLTFDGFRGRILFREALQGILTESIRTRRDKGEIVRISDTLNKFKDAMTQIHKEVVQYDRENFNEIFNYSAIIKEAKGVELNPDANIANQVETVRVLINYLRYQNLQDFLFLNSPKLVSSASD